MHIGTDICMMCVHNIIQLAHNSTSRCVSTKGQIYLVSDDIVLDIINPRRRVAQRGFTVIGLSVCVCPSLIWDCRLQGDERYRWIQNDKVGSYKKGDCLEKTAFE